MANCLEMVTSFSYSLMVQTLSSHPCTSDKYKYKQLNKIRFGEVVRNGAYWLFNNHIWFIWVQGAAGYFSELQSNGWFSHELVLRAGYCRLLYYRVNVISIAEIAVASMISLVVSKRSLGTIEQR